MAKSGSQPALAWEWRSTRHTSPNIRRLARKDCGAGSVSQPLVEVAGDEGVIVQVGIATIDAVDFLALTAAEDLVAVQAPGAFEQALAAEDLVQARDAARVAVGSIEESGIGIGDLDRPAQHRLRDKGVGLDQAAALAMKLDRLTRPNRPMPQKTSDNSSHRFLAVALETKRSQEVHHDVVVVASIERNVIAARFNDRANDVDCLIAVERSNFDGYNRVNFGKTAPEVVRKNATTGSGLEVEPEQRDRLGDGLAM